MTPVTGAEFNRRPSRVKRAAALEPVVITEHNRPTFVLMSYAEYQRLHRAPDDLASWLEMSAADEAGIDFEIDPVGLELRSADL